MQAVRFTRAMAPHGAGDTRMLPDDVAKRLEAEGAVELGSFPGGPFASDGRFVPYETKDAVVKRGSGRFPKVHD